MTIHPLRFAALAGLLVATASCAQASSESVSSDQAQGPTAEVPSCPTFEDREARPDPRAADLGDADLRSLVAQRAYHDLCDVPTDHLFDDPESWDLYGRHGIVLLPQEEDGWVRYRDQLKVGRDVIEALRGEAGFFDVKTDARAGTYTVWATAAATPSFEARATDAGVKDAIQFEGVRNDRVAMEKLAAEVLAALSADQREAVIETDLEPDRLVFIVDETIPSAATIENQLEGGLPAAAARASSVTIEARLGQVPVGRTQLCSSRGQCAPAGGGQRITTPDGSCSTGPPVVDPTGRRAVSTAGHCVDAGEPGVFTTNRNDSSNVPPGTALSFNTIASDYIDGGERDFAAIYNAVNTHYVQNLYYRDPSSRLNEIRSVSGPMVGDRACLSGQKAQAARCGHITDIDKR